MNAGELVQQAAATVSALTVLAGGAAYLLLPRVNSYLRSQASAAATVRSELPGAAELSTVTASTALATGQRLDELAAELRELRTVIAERLDSLEAVLIRAYLEHGHNEGVEPYP